MQMSLVAAASASARPLAWRGAARVALYAAALCGAFILAAYVGRVPPLDRVRAGQSDAERALAGVPFDAPLPYDITLVGAGRGRELPNRVEWVSELPPSEAGAQVLDHLAKSPKWQATQFVDLRGEFRQTFARTGSDGYLTHFAVMTLRAQDARTIVEFEFMRLDLPASMQ